MMKVESNSCVVWAAVGLFAISEAIHKSLIFTDLLVMPAHGFAVISRVLIYAWFSWQLAAYGFSVSRFVFVVILVNIFEFLILGTLSVIALGILEGMELVVPGLTGLVFSYPLVLVVVLVQCLLVFGISRWRSVKGKTKVGA